MPRSKTKTLEPKPLFKLNQPEYIYMSNSLGDLGKLVPIKVAEKKIAENRGIGTFKWIENIYSPFQKADTHQPPNRNLELYFNNLHHIYKLFVIAQLGERRQGVIARADIDGSLKNPVMIALYSGESKTIVCTPEGEVDQQNNPDLIGDEYISVFLSSESTASGICTSAKDYGNHAGIFEYAPPEEELENSFLDAEQRQKVAHRNVISDFLMHYGIPCRLVVTIEKIKQGEGLFLDYGNEHLTSDLNREFYLYDKQSNILIKNARLYLKKTEKIAALKQAITNLDRDNIFARLLRSHKDILKALNRTQLQSLQDVKLELHCYSLYIEGLLKFQKEKSNGLRREFSETENALYVLYPYLITIRDHEFLQEEKLATDFNFFQSSATPSSLKQEVASTTEYNKIMEELDQKAIQILTMTIDRRSKISKDEFASVMNDQLQYWDARKTSPSFNHFPGKLINYYWYTGMVFREMAQADAGIENLQQYIALQSQFIDVKKSANVSTEKLQSMQSDLALGQTKLLECRILKAEQLMQECYPAAVEKNVARIDSEKFAKHLPAILEIIESAADRWREVSNSILFSLCATNYHSMLYHLMGDGHEIKSTISEADLNKALACLVNCKILIKVPRHQAHANGHRSMMASILFWCVTTEQFINKQENFPNKKEWRIKYLEICDDLMNHFDLKNLKIGELNIKRQHIEEQLADLKGYEHYPTYCSIS